MPHVDDLLTDPAPALLAGLSILPKKSALTDYSYRLSHDHQQRLLAALDRADALSSAVNLNVDLDVVLCVLAQALTAAFRLRLPGNYAHATPDTLQRRFLDTPGEITNQGTSITVKINRRAYSPVLRDADLPEDTAVPGGADARSTSNSPDPGAEVPARKSALVPAPASPGR